MRLLRNFIIAQTLMFATILVLFLYNAILINDRMSVIELHCDHTFMAQLDNLERLNMAQLDFLNSNYVINEKIYDILKNDSIY